jgi:hypothetical protein
MSSMLYFRSFVLFLYCANGLMIQHVNKLELN